MKLNTVILIKSLCEQFPIVINFLFFGMGFVVRTKRKHISEKKQREEAHTFWYFGYDGKMTMEQHENIYMYRPQKS